MNTFISDIKKLFIKLLGIEPDSGQNSEKDIQSAVTTSKTVKCYKQAKEASYYVSKFNSFTMDKRDFVRLLIEVPVKNNVKTKNIDTIMGYVKMFESYFIYMDYCKLYFGDGLIYIDIYRENKFPSNIFNKKKDK